MNGQMDRNFIITLVAVDPLHSTHAQFEVRAKMELCILTTWTILLCVYSNSSQNVSVPQNSLLVLPFQ